MSTNQSEIAVNKPLHGIFSDVPPKYDLINSVITWNMDKRWRKLAALACLASRPERVLDLCCGTGDLTVNIARLADYAVEIKGLDFSSSMLERAEQKAAPFLTERKPVASIRFVRGNADNMPFPSAYFDCVGISFAFRNLTFKNPLVKEHLSEIVRVLKPGGRFVIVESSQPENRIIRTLDHFYFRCFIATAGKLISGNRGAYQYLAESASRYYTPAELKELLVRSGFKTVSYRPLFFGAAGLHIAEK